MLAKDILKQEKDLSFDSFTNEDGYNISNLIVQSVKEENLRNVRIRVVLNNEIVFQYLMNGKSGEMWLNRKQNTVERFHHSGYYLFLENEENGTYKEYENDESIVFCGGGFPITVKGEVVGSIMVSGLEHQEDHQLIVDAIRKYKGE